MPVWLEASLIVGGWGVVSWFHGSWYSARHILATLQSQGWKIVDSDGRVREVKGT